jgi:L-2-hydroxyglutarate oxidase LhgO
MYQVAFFFLTLMIVRTAISCNNNFHIQTAIIGAGVVGLAVARGLSKKGHEVLLLEQSNIIGSGISSRNSEVIHAGIYYEKDTLKAKLCVEGKKLLYQNIAKNETYPIGNVERF